MIGDREDMEVEQETEGISVDGFVAAPSSRPPPSRGRFRTNLISNATLFGFNLIVGLWYTPYLIDHLGAAAYGIVPLVSQITGYMVVVTATLNSAVGRYITIALERRDDEEANRYFNTSLFGSVLLVLLLIPPAAWATVNVQRLIVIPADLETQTRWLFACTAAAFFLGTFQSPFGVSTYCLNRFDLQNAISLIQQVARVGIVVAFFSIVAPQVWQVGVAALASMFLGWGWSIRLWRRLTPTLHISTSHISREALKHLFSMGGWIAVNNIGMILFVSIDLLVVNRMLGPDAGGRYAAVLQWSSLLRTFAGVIAMLFGPTIFYCYARKDFAELTGWCRRAVRMMAIVVSLPIGGICGFAYPLLMVWLGKDFADLDKLMILMTCHLCVNLAIIPLFNIQTATNHVSLPGVLMIVAGAGNLALALTLAGPAGWGMYGVAAAGAIVLSVKNFVFTPLYNARLLGMPWHTFFPDTILAVVLTGSVAAACMSIEWAIPITSWAGLIIGGASVAAAYAAAVYGLILTGEERSLVADLLLLRKMQ